MCLNVKSVEELNMCDTLVETQQECYRCGQENVYFEEKYELCDPETEETSYHDGLVCKDCGCFHALDHSFYQYHSSKSLHTNYNVRSWLN